MLLLSAHVRQVVSQGLSAKGLEEIIFHSTSNLLLCVSWTTYGAL